LSGEEVSAYQDDLIEKAKKVITLLGIVEELKKTEESGIFEKLNAKKTNWLKKAEKLKKEGILDKAAELEDTAEKFEHTSTKTVESQGSIRGVFSRISKLIINQANGDAYNLFNDAIVPLVRENKNNELEIAYFNVDALCEKMEAYTSLYPTKDALPNHLKKAKYIINIPESDMSRYWLVEDKKGKYGLTEEQKEKENAAKEHIKEQYQIGLSHIKEQLLNLVEDDRLDDKSLYELIRDAQGKESDYLWKIKRLCPYVDTKFLINNLYEVCLKNRKAYRGFINSLYFWVLDNNHPFKMQVINTFKAEQKYSSDEIETLLSPIVKYHFYKTVSKSRLVNLFKSIYKCTYTAGKNRIKEFNPLDMPEPKSKLGADIDNLNNYFEI
jgi:hypothetical protein